MTITREQIESFRRFAKSDTCGLPFRSDVVDAICDAALRATEPAPSKVICHAPGDRCLGCNHYYGKAPVCQYAEPAPGEVPESVAAFEDFLNEPPQYEEQYRVREYRHEAYPKWRRAIEDMQRLIATSKPAPEHAELPLVFKVLVDWERNNGALAGILEHEWPSLMRDLAAASVAQSPRQAADALSQRVEVNEEMIDRFLTWPLPKTFAPDGGISFTKFYHGVDNGLHPYKPIGTNLFTADETRQMLEYVLAGKESGR